MRKPTLIAMLTLCLWACGDTGTSDGRSGGVDLETHCRAWCEPETGCDEGQGTPLQCLDSCLANAERDPCFSHVVTYQECVLDMECADPFEDCEKPEGLSMPRGAGVPVCETIDNAYARCTCENLPDNGTGGTGGAAGAGGFGGVGGTGGRAVECVTSALCSECPFTPLCDMNSDCTVGSTCTETGCNTLEGAPIKKCVFTGGGPCVSNADCPAGHECQEVPELGRRCVQTVPG